jgi:hypothetical protein
MNFQSLKTVFSILILVCNIASVRGLICGPNEVEIWVYNSFLRFNEQRCVTMARCYPNGIPADLKCTPGVCNCPQTYCSSNVFAIGYPDETQVRCGECVIFDASVNQNRPLYFGLVSNTYSWPDRSITCRECDSVNEYRTMVANQWLCQGIACRDCPSCRMQQCTSCGANLPPSFYQQNLVNFGYEHTCCHNKEDVRQWLNLPLREYQDDGQLVEKAVPAPACAPNWILVTSFQTNIWNNEYLENE